jgi:flagellar biosynthesis protein FlhG
VPVLADGLGDLSRAALDVAVSRAADDDPGAQTVVCIPPEWLRKAADGAAILRRVLLFTSPDPTELIETYALAKHLCGHVGGSALGVTVYGVQRVEAAARAFERLAGTAERHLGCRLSSYGLLVDELQIYRAIVERRPIGVAHPQSRAARSLRDVARLLLDDVTAVAE